MDIWEHTNAVASGGKVCKKEQNKYEIFVDSRFGRAEAAALGAAMPYDAPIDGLVSDKRGEV